jgi:hypothetical protein
MAQNITDITPPRVAFLDPRTGKIAREWYRFFLNLFVLTGSGTSDLTILDLAVAPGGADTAAQLASMESDALINSMMAQYDQAMASIQGAYLQPQIPALDIQFDPLSYAAPAVYQETQRAFSAWGSATTIASGFGTSPSLVTSNGTAAFALTIGAGGTASSGVISLPPAPNGWKLGVENVTATHANRADQRTVQWASTTTSATLQNQTVSTGAALAWNAADVLLISALAY